MKKYLILIPFLFIYIIGIKGQIKGDVTLKKEDISFSKSGKFDIIHLKDCSSYETQVGAPELPIITKTFVIPVNAKVTGINATTSNINIIEDYQPIPAKQAEAMNDNSVFPLALDSTIYQGTHLFPADETEIMGLC